VSAGSHGVSVNLGLDVGVSNGVGLEPRDVDLDVEVTDAEERRRKGTRKVSFGSRSLLFPSSTSHLNH